MDVLIEERAPVLLHRPVTGWLMRRFLYPLLGYGAAKEAIDRIRDLSGPETMDLGVAELGLRVSALGLARVPQAGRVVVASNHPTGLADGVAVWQALRERRPDVMMLANGDAMRISAGLRDVFIPVEWTKSKRSQAGSRQLLKDVAAAFAQERALVIFPSGRIAYLRPSGLSERPWLPTVVTLARKFTAPILPLHIRARNSALFYGLSRISHELRDVTLFHELLNKGGQRYVLTFGHLIDPARLPDDPARAVELLQHHVEHELPRASGSPPRLEPPSAHRLAGLNPGGGRAIG